MEGQPFSLSEPTFASNVQRECRENLSKDIMQESFGRVAKYLKSEAQTWGQVFGLVLAFFILVTAISNAIYGIFGFALLPIFENTLEHLREFFYGLFDLVLYVPISAVLEWLAEAILKVQISIPPPPTWYIDLVLVSMILSRAERAAMKMADPITDNIGVERSSLERVLWGVVLFFYVPTKAILFPFKRFAPDRVYSVLRIFLDGVTWLGFWFFLHDLAVVRQYRGQHSEAVKSHRAFVLFLVLSLLAATAASLVFFVMNGYVHHYF